MSQPPAPYDRSYSFTDFSESNPTTPHQGQKIDQELNNARTSINSTIARLGEVQADDGKIRTTALNLTVIAEEVEPLLTDAPVQAVEAAGAQQIGLVNDAGDAKVAEIEAVLTSQNALDAIAARDAAQSAAYEADLSKISAANSAGLANTYANTALQAKNSAQVHAQVAVNAAASIPLIVGPAGPQGQQGQRGEQGLTGPVGPVGPVGQQGIQGPQGIQGINGDQYATTSTTTNIVGNGTKTFVVEQDLAYTTQQNVVVAFDAGNHMHGAVLGYDSSTGVIAIDVSQHTGNGTHSSWTINLEGAAGIQGPQGIQGIQGQAGVEGQAGQTGPQGVQGNDGPQGPAGNAWIYTGAYDNGRTYQVNDMVECDGSSYVMSNYIGASGYYPSSYPSHWQVVALRGATGADGPAGSSGSNGNDGPQGPAGPNPYIWNGIWDYSRYYNVNEVVSYDGSSYVCSGANGGNYPYEGSSNWQLLARRGDTGSQGGNGNDGSQGPEGPQGPQGPGVINWRGPYDYSTYYNLNDAVSYDGSSYICNSQNSGNYPYEGSPIWGLLSRKGDQGPQGNDGSGGSSPYYYHSVWAYNTWYSANVTTVYDTNYNYVNVLTF